MEIEFETVKSLAKCGRVDLLILVADAVAFVRNVDFLYFPKKNSELDKFFGADANWREKWQALGSSEGPNARKFIADTYKQQLRRIGYIKFGEKTISGTKGPLYRLIFASKHPLGLEFWEKVTRKDAGGQTEMF